MAATFVGPVDPDRRFGGGWEARKSLACTMAGASMLAVECDPARIKRRLDMGFVDVMETDLDRALDRIEDASPGQDPHLCWFVGQRG